jgi:hypothetical protein
MQELFNILKEIKQELLLMKEIQFGKLLDKQAKRRPYCILERKTGKPIGAKFKHAEKAIERAKELNDYYKYDKTGYCIVIENPMTLKGKKMKPLLIYTPLRIGAGI